MKYVRIILKFLIMTVIVGLVALIFKSLYKLIKEWRTGR